ncbi:hypothetical protein DW712_07000 [Bacteroides intestinalis]|uniref:Uncharacterized protein n=1 Tax=Bacteroides intestinalis TaxID=329854 RepID=A0A414LGM1_9BACE|nr:hypothetical protein DW712_07000 [Bacteroides intestinalis]
MVGNSLYLVSLLTCLLFLYCGCKSTHKNETNKQFIKKMRDKTTKILFYPAKKNKKILFILSLMILLPE